MTYRFFDLTLASTLGLPELRPAHGGAPVLRVHLGRGRQWVGGRWRWFRVWEASSGLPWLKTGKDDTRYLLRFPRVADFLIEPDGVTTRCYPRHGVARAMVRHLLLDQVLPLVVSNQGRIILHASAVSTPVGGVAFLAAAGTGKSTLAASLCQAGWPLVADDTLLVAPAADGVRATASYPGVRLWPSSLAALGGVAPPRRGSDYSDKRRLAPPAPGYRFRSRPVTLTRLYILDPAPGEGVTVGRVSRRDALVELVKHAYTLDIDDRLKVAGHFERLYRHRRALGIRRLSFPRGFAHLAAVRDAIRRDLRLTDRAASTP